MMKTLKQLPPDFPAFAEWLDGHGIEAVGVQDDGGRISHLLFSEGETAFVAAPRRLDDGQIRLAISQD